jgi:hypothetical protein
MSRERVVGAALQRGLVVATQVDSWGERGEFNVRLYRDCISPLRKADHTKGEGR